MPKPKLHGGDGDESQIATSGGSACIFGPPLMRDGETGGTSYDHLVGRVAMNSTLAKTIAKGALFSAVDAAGAYGVYALGPARPLRLDSAVANAGSEANLDACRNIPGVRPTLNTAQAVFLHPLSGAKVVSTDVGEVLFARANGGSLDTALKALSRDGTSSATVRLARVTAYVVAFANLVRGLALFAGTGLLVMGDIKPANIVIMRGSWSAPQELKFIDFDDARRLEDVFHGTAPMPSATWGYLSLLQWLTMRAEPVLKRLQGLANKTEVPTRLILDDANTLLQMSAVGADVYPTWIRNAEQLVAMLPYTMWFAYNAKNPVLSTLQTRLGDTVMTENGENRLRVGIAVQNDIFALCVVTFAELWAALTHTRFEGDVPPYVPKSVAGRTFPVSAQLLPFDDAHNRHAITEVFEALNASGIQQLVGIFVRDASCGTLWTSQIVERFDAIVSALARISIE
jgi:hypothetical protein